MSRAGSPRRSASRSSASDLGGDAYELHDLSKLDSPSESLDSFEISSDDVDQRSEAPPPRHRTRRSRRPSFELYTPDEERVVLRKLDWHLVLLVALLYLLSFLDRSNIGNARIAGLSADLRLSSAQYEWLLTAFYITYVAFEWMTLLYAVLPAHVYISLCVASWGLVASLQSVATSFEWMFLLRGLLGIAEAAFGPGVPFYLSFFFRREELAFRTGLFIAAAPLATSFASSLAWAITYLGERSPFAPWRLLFLVEGFPSMVVAVAAWWNIPDRPESATFLTARQRKVAKLRLRREKGAEEDHSTKETKSKGLRWRQIGRTLTDPKAYLTAVSPVQAISGRQSDYGS